MYYIIYQLEPHFNDWIFKLNIGPDIKHIQGDIVIEEGQMATLSRYCMYRYVGSYFRRNFRGGRRGGGPGPMNRGGYRRMRPRNNYQGQGGGAPRANGAEGEGGAPAAPKSKPVAKPATAATIEATTNESQA